MSTLLALVRDDLRDFGGYKSARTEALQGEVWLNANESAWANPADLLASIPAVAQHHDQFRLACGQLGAKAIIQHALGCADAQRIAFELQPDATLFQAPLAL